MGTATFIQDETEFDSFLKTESLLVVDCTATWCGPCKLVAPLMDQLAEEYGDRAKVLKIDLDSNKPVAKRLSQWGKLATKISCETSRSGK